MQPLKPISYFQLLPGMVWIFSILWVRLFREYLPKEWPELLALPLWRTGYLSLIFLALEIFALHQLYWPIQRVSGMSRILEILPGRKYWAYWAQAPSTVFPWVWSKLPESIAIPWALMLMKIMKFFRYRLQGFWAAKLACLVVAILPLFLVGSVFFWEIWALGRLKYFYLLFPLLLLPLLGRAFLSMMVYLAKKNMANLSQWMKEEKGPDGLIYLHLKVSLDPETWKEWPEVWGLSRDFLTYEPLLDGLKNYLFRMLAPWLWALYLGGWGNILYHQIWILALNYPYYF